MRWRSGVGALVMLAGLAMTAAASAQTGPAGPVTLSRPWALPAPLGGDTSVMFELHNFGTVQDDLLAAGCATAESAELVGPASGDGAPVHMVQLGLAPGQTAQLSPTGVRIVLHHLNVAARAGQTLHCTATLAKSGERLFEAAVQASNP